MRRSWDRWGLPLLTVLSIAGPFAGFAMARVFQMGTLYQTFKTDHDTLIQVVAWKDDEVKFNAETIAAISRLKEITKELNDRFDRRTTRS